jgi:hypothetical protein
MNDLYLRVEYRGIRYEFPVASADDNDADADQCLLVVSLNTATKLQALMQEKAGHVLRGELVDHSRGRSPPVGDQRELRILRASPITHILDASTVGGAEVVAQYVN